VGASIRPGRAPLGEQPRDMRAQLRDAFAAARRGEQQLWIGSDVLAQALQRQGSARVLLGSLPFVLLRQHHSVGDDRGVEHPHCLVIAVLQAVAPVDKDKDAQERRSSRSRRSAS